MRYNNYREDTTETVVTTLLMLSSIVIAFFTAYYLWNANEGENWLVALRLMLVNTLGIGTALFVTNFHYLLGVGTALVAGTIAIAYW